LVAGSKGLSSSARRRLASGGLALFAAAVVWLYHPLEQPILGDRAYLVYLGQALLRGEPIYARTFMGYPPVGPLLSALSMWVGSLVGVPTWLAPRFAGIALLVASVVALQHLVTRATARPAAGVLAGIVLASFGALTVVSAQNLEPKGLVLAATIAAGLALQRRRFATTGFAAGLAAMCWQPGVLVPVAFLLPVLRETWLRGRKPLLRYVGGGLAAGLPAAFYITATNTWREFLERSVGIPLAAQVQEFGTRPGHWLETVRVHYGTDELFFAAAALGLAGFSVRSLRRGHRARTWLHPRMGAFPVLAPLLVAAYTTDSQGPLDLVPVLPVVAFFCGWLLHAMLGALGRRWPEARALRRGVAAAVIAAAASYGAADAWLWRPLTTLQKQREVVREILQGTTPDDLVVSFEATGLYALSERPAPLPLLSLNKYFVHFTGLVGHPSCEALLSDLLEQEPRVVVYREWAWQSGCVRALDARLQELGYRPRLVKFAEPIHSRLPPRLPRFHVWRAWRLDNRAVGARESAPGDRHPGEAEQRWEEID
jgi:hypothetical protein